MKSALQIFNGLRKGPGELVGIEIGAENVRAVRMKKSSSTVTVSAADLLEPIPRFSFGAPQKEDVEIPGPFALPASLRAKHAALVYAGDKAIIKLLNFPGQFDADAESKLIMGLGLSDKVNNYRIGYKITLIGQGKAESRALGVAVPEEHILSVMDFFEAGLPVPYSIECADLAAMTTFLHGPGLDHEDDCVGVLNFGVGGTCFSIFDKGTIALTRIFSVGLNSFVKQVQRSLGVDSSTAAGILADGSFDVSQSIDEVAEPLVKQLLLSRDFVERRENCHMSAIYFMGNALAARCANNGINEATGMEPRTWNPFDHLTVEENALSDEITGQEWQFASVIGACLGTFEDT